MPIVKCDYCNIEFFKKDKEIKKTKHNFCCKKCYDKFKITKKIVYCANCGKKFEVILSRSKQSKIFCSSNCAYEYKRKSNLNKTKNEIIKTNEYAIIHTKNGNLKIDIQDIDKVKTFRWFLGKDNYGRTTIYLGDNKHKQILLHRFLLDVSDCSYPLVDHINRDTTDNRRCNLRLVTHKQNAQNVSLAKDNKTGYTGVFFNKRANVFSANIQRDKVNKYLGSFKTIEEAIEARQKAEIKYMKEGKL